MLWHVVYIILYYITLFYIISDHVICNIMICYIMPCVFFVGTDSRSNSQSDGSKALLLSNQMMLYNRYQMLIIYISLLFPELIHRGRRTDIDVRPIPLLTLCVYIYIYLFIYTHVLMLVCWLCAPSRTMFLPS